MSDYTVSYAIRYKTPSLSQQIEVAVVTAAIAIQNEDPNTLNHATRLAWANWAISVSSVAWVPFAWALAMNATIVGELKTDASGNAVLDSDVQFVVNSNIDAVVAGWKAPA